jgi:hypothetical protein
MSCRTTRAALPAKGCEMANTDGVFVFAGTYSNEAAARSNYDLVKDLHAAGAVGAYDEAVVTRWRPGMEPTRSGSSAVTSQAGRPSKAGTRSCAPVGAD